MEKTIYCPICKRKVGDYDGKATINQMYRCKKCNKKIVYYTDTGETKAKSLPIRTTSSGVTFI